MTVRSNARVRGVRGRVLSTLRGLGGRAIVIVLTAIIGILVAVIDIQLTPKSYEATAQVFVTVSSVSDAGQLYNGDQFTQSRVQSYINIVDSPDITGPVSRQLSSALSERQIADRVSADAPLNKVLINIHARDGSASRAARIANLVAAQFTKTIQRIETAQRVARSQSAQSPVKLTITHPADAPLSPVAPQKTLLLLAGLLGGALVGLLIIVVRDRLLRRVRTPQDLETLLASPPLGVVPKDRHTDREPNAFRASGAARAEAYRQLRTNLQFVDIDNPPKIIAVSSPIGAEGKTAVALNLAVALAEAGVSVVLVETDLRQPVLAELLNLDDTVGLTSVLVGSADVDEVIQQADRGLAVITSGPTPFNPSEMLASKQARATIAEIAERFEYVILDAVSMLPLADGAETASLADVTVLVGRAGRTSPDNIRASVGAIRRVGGTFAGVVLNAASVSRWVASERRPRPVVRVKPEAVDQPADTDAGTALVDGEGDETSGSVAAAEPAADSRTASRIEPGSTGEQDAAPAPTAPISVDAIADVHEVEPVESASNEPPVDEPSVVEPPVDEPPVDEPPVDEPPVDEPPVDESPTPVKPARPQGADRANGGRKSANRSRAAQGRNRSTAAGRQGQSRRSDPPKG